MEEQFICSNILIDDTEVGFLASANSVVFADFGDPTLISHLGLAIIEIG